MNLATLFLYGLAITTITVYGSIKYIAAKKREETQNVSSHYSNWGN